MAAKLVIGVGITAIGMFGADSMLGTWKYNAAKSKTTAVNYSFTFKYDGKEYPVTGAPFDTVSSKRIDANTTGWEVKISFRQAVRQAEAPALLRKRGDSGFRLS